MRYLFIFCALLTTLNLKAAPSGETIRKLQEEISPSIVPIKYSLEIKMGSREQIQEGNCYGTLIDKKGVVLVSNTYINPQSPNPSVTVNTINILVVIGKTTYHARQIYKDAARDMAFLRIGKQEGEDAEIPEDRTFSQVTFAPRSLKIAEELIGFGRFSEREDYAPLYLPVVVSGIVNTPKLYYSMTRPSGRLAGTPVFDESGKAVALCLYETITTATGRAQSTRNLVIQPVKDIEEIFAKLPTVEEEEAQKLKEQKEKEDKENKDDDEDNDDEDESDKSDEQSPNEEGDE